MTRPAIKSIKLSDSLVLSEYHPTSERPGKYWLYDKTVGMNLAMGAKNEQAALLEVIRYHQECHNELKKAYFDLKNKVDIFVHQFVDSDSEE